MKAVVSRLGNNHLDRRHVSVVAIVLSLAGRAALAGDSLPPLKDGRVPATLDELWGNYDPRTEPLEVEVVKEWAVDNPVFRYVCYTIGTFKGQKARMLAYYAFPKGQKTVPAILHIHGGGQSASFDEVKYAVDHEYAGMSLNWGGNTRLENWKPGDLNTDWGAMDCTHPHRRECVYGKSTERGHLMSP